MSVKFNVIEKRLLGTVNQGETKFYASAKMNGEMTLAGLTRSIEKISTVSGADIRAVLYGLVDVMTDNLNDGKIVRLGELGSLRVSISSEGKDIAEDVNASCIKKSKIIFTPGNRIKKMLDDLEYQKA